MFIFFLYEVYFVILLFEFRVIFLDYKMFEESLFYWNSVLAVY